jgi:hypothetical protein
MAAEYVSADEPGLTERSYRRATTNGTRTDGTRFRNTEVLTFDGDRISKVEVYFGWELERGARSSP